MRTHSWPTMKALVLGVGLCLAITAITPMSSHAIPSAGTYDFTSGFTGTFTSNGSALTAWDFSLRGSEWTSSLAGGSVVANNPAEFSQSSLPSGIIVHLGWGAGIGNTGIAGLEIIPHLVIGLLPPFTYTPHQSVPEPSDLVLLGVGVGLLGLAESVRRQRRLAEGQIG